MTEYDDIYGRGIAREATIWPVFAFNGPFSDIHNTERNLVFGLYSGTYLHGLNYLKEIQSEDLIKVIEVYNNNMAQLDADRAKLALDVVAKRYLEQVNSVIHNSQMRLKQQGIEALNTEFDAKLEALSADEAALETKRYETTIKQEEIKSRIVELEAAILIESVNRDMVELDVLQKQLQESKVNLQIVDAGLRALDIQLAITQIGIDMANTDVSIADAKNSESEIDLKISDVDIDRSELQNKLAEIDLELQEVSGYARENINIQTKQIAARIVEIETAEAELAVKESELNVAIKKIEADGLKLDLINSDLIIINAQKAVKDAENELLRLKLGMIEADTHSIEAETALVGNQMDGQEELDAKKVELVEASGNAYITGISGDMTLREYGNQLEFDQFDSKRGIADDAGDATVLEVELGQPALDGSVLAADYRASGAESAASIVANANITNTLTHAIG